MAVHTRHPVSAPPSAPARETTGHLLLRAWAGFVLFGALATTFWFNLLGAVGLALLLGASVIVSAAVWVRVRPTVALRQLPWIPLAYVVWAGVSVLWSTWPQATLITWSALVVTTAQAIFVGSILTWREIVRALASALMWVLGLSVAFELWVSLVLHRPVLPNFVLWDGAVVTELYWSRDNLFDGGQIQGIVGNSHLLAIVSLLAIIVFAIRLAAGAPGRAWQIGWIVVAAFLMWRATSASVWVAALAAGAVLGTALLMRTTSRPGERTKYYVAYAGLGAAGLAVAWFGRDIWLDILGKSGDLTGRVGIWDAVAARAAEHPVLGWGYSTPWLPWVPEFDGWIIINDLTVFHAHSAWLDVFFQLGVIGTALFAATYLGVIWRGWFFAIDRPRWDLRADRPFQAETLLPTLVMTVLLVQSLAESRPLSEWGWLLVVLFTHKMGQAPLVGEGPAERTLALERGEGLRRVRG
ncbi:O-antigen ligase family protein [Microbacterium sp. LRZ72]|uniref:O-antigen ligase family protein n=1 Tax=Microbacterium sp. LRZ72 TaxID=2942481 RepID=UPI0029B2C532|nr:O-antigen ligase family protein [Microbacterium sp. LRZ72]MDX2377035.1 O-antigen ligase family protein [Microbacterium sp. LRZ72]